MVKKYLSDKVIVVDKTWRMRKNQPCENPAESVPEGGSSRDPEVKKDLSLHEKQKKTREV